MQVVFDHMIFCTTSFSLSQIKLQCHVFHTIYLVLFSVELQVLSNILR